MFENWSQFILAFAGFMLIGLLIYLMGNQKKRPEERKNNTYTCGEPFEKVDVSAANFYDVVKSNLHIDYIRKVHSGRLSDYLLWMVVGIVSVLIMVAFI